MFFIFPENERKWRKFRSLNRNRQEKRDPLVVFFSFDSFWVFSIWIRYMRKHGWELPYHPLQVVAVAVFLALACAFYVFFAPFVGTKMLQYVAMGLYTPLIICVFGLYVWSAAADPADPGVFKSKKYLNIPDNGKHRPNDSKLGGESTSSIHDANAASVEMKSVDPDVKGARAIPKDPATEVEEKNAPSVCSTNLLAFLLPFAFVFKCSSSSEESSDQQMSEDGMFYCSLCEVEVNRHSKHCRVCDKCVDCFDHHCRWLNNCIGKRNYRKFFTLMVSALLLLILQWATGIFVLICCFLKHKQFSVDITAKLGSSFSLVPFVIVVSVCTILAMLATLPLVQLFFFHILLIKKGISTYDYIIALREQEQEQQGVGDQQSPHMSPASSLTGLSSVSSFTTLQRSAWCTPPRLFLEDQFDVVPPETSSIRSFGKKAVREEPMKKKNPAAVKISPWALARLNAEEVSKAAAQARKKSKILQPVSRRNASFSHEPDSSIGSGHRHVGPRPENSRKRTSKRIRLPADVSIEQLSNIGFMDNNTSRSLAPLQLEARSAFHTSRAMSSSAGFVASSSPESSLDSPDLHPFRVSSSGAEEAMRITGLSVPDQRGIPLPMPRSSSDGYEASGGEDSDRVPSRIVERSTTNWSNMLFGYDQDEEGVYKLRAASSSSSNANTRIV